MSTPRRARLVTIERGKRLQQEVTIVPIGSVARGAQGPPGPPGGGVDVFTSSTVGTVPASGGGTVNFLRADGSWIAPPGGGGAATQLDADGSLLDVNVIADGNVLRRTGTTVVGATCTAAGYALIDDADAAAQRTTLGLVAVASTGSAADLTTGTLPVARVADGSLDLAKLADMAAGRALGRAIGAGSGVPSPLSSAQLAAMVALFTSSLAGTVPASGGGTSNFLRADGTWVAPPGGGGGAQGTATVNFGVFPGQSDVTLAVTGQAGIVAGSVLQAWLRPTNTADHSVDEHVHETIRITAGDIVAGVGFSIFARNDSELHEQPADILAFPRVGGTGLNRPTPQQRGTRLYGQWSVAWRWS